VNVFNAFSSIVAVLGESLRYLGVVCMGGAVVLAYVQSSCTTAIHRTSPQQQPNTVCRVSEVISDWFSKCRG